MSILLYFGEIYNKYTIKFVKKVRKIASRLERKKLKPHRKIEKSFRVYHYYNYRWLARMKIVVKRKFFYWLTISNFLYIIILIILATITINIAFGDNGLIKRAEQAKDLYANGSTSELDILNQVDEYLKEKIDKAKSPDTPVEPVIPYTEVYATLYEDGILGFSNNESNIEGLTPISGKSWNITDEVFSAEWGLEEAPYYNVTTPWFADRESIKKVVFSNEIVPKSVTALFMGCTNLTTIEGIENLNTSNVSSLSAMFDDCVSLTSIDLSNFKTSNVTDMNSMFEGYSYDMSLTEIIGLDKLDTSKVTDMSYMFYRM